VMDLAGQEDIALREDDIDLYDAYNADEVFLTSTSLCICPVTRLNGVEIGPAGQVWGPVTQRLADGYRRLVDCDFVGQYLKHYVDGMESRAF
jgi:branched-chain amino acid aminotransferase